MLVSTVRFAVLNGWVCALCLAWNRILRARDVGVAIGEIEWVLWVSFLSI